jgi:multiple antibiotic resistance protein
MDGQYCLVFPFWLCFVPLLVAVDAIGVLPMFMGLTEGLVRPVVRQVLRQSLIDIPDKICGIAT